MAQASADIKETDLEQRILQVLKDAGTPMKAAQLAKKCQVPKKDINRALYRMKNKLQVDLLDSAKWRLREGGPGEMVPTEPAPPSHELQEQILRLLARGPQRALSIAQSLGMNTSKDVNPCLYAMQENHLLDLDKSSNTWKIYQPGTPRAPRNIYPQSSVTICQNGPYSHISIQNSEAIQIGHGNTIVKLMAPAESGSTAPCSLPPPPAAGPLGQDPPAGPWGPQDIRIDNTVLKGVQLGQGNEMNVHSTPATGPGRSPPVSAATAGPEEIRMPAPGPHPEGAGDAAQSVPIKPCFLEEDAIGNSNSLSVCRAGAGAGPEASRGDPREPAEDPGEPAEDSGEPAEDPGEPAEDPGEPAEDAAPGPRAAEPRGKFPDGAGRADPDMSTFTSHLEAMTLRDRDSEAPEDSP